MPPRKNKRGDRGSIEDEPRNSKKSNMAAEENIDVEEPDERLNEQKEPSLFEIKALLVDIQIQVAAIYWVAYGNPVGKWVDYFFFTGLPMANPVEVCVDFVVFFIFFRVGKSLACHSPAKWWLCA